MYPHALQILCESLQPHARRQAISTMCLPCRPVQAPDQAPAQDTQQGSPAQPVLKVQRKPPGPLRLSLGAWGLSGPIVEVWLALLVLQNVGGLALVRRGLKSSLLLACSVAHRAFCQGAFCKQAGQGHTALVSGIRGSKSSMTDAQHHQTMGQLQGHMDALIGAVWPSVRLCAL